METIYQLEAVQAAPETFVMSTFAPLPGLGVVPANSFLIRATEPILIDTGLTATSDAFMSLLEQYIDFDDLRWVWLTHTDPDHIGAIEKVLARAKNARVVTTFLGVGKMDLHRPLPLDRVYLLNPGQELDLGDRKLFALRPPVYDAPETTAVFDPKTHALFSADCFGALLQEPATRANAIADDDLREGMLTWASVDAPWLESIREDAFFRSIAAMERLAPKYVFSAHLPAAVNMADKLADNLRSARGVSPFVGPDQAALEAMLKGEAPVAEPEPPAPSAAL